MKRGGYPPGVNAGTPNAPWNDEPVQECEFCGGVYTEDGHEDVDGEPCPNDGMTMTDLKDAAKAEKAERQMDQRRINEALEGQ